MPAKLRPGAAAIALAIATTSAVVVTPQRPAPQSISTKHPSVVPCFCAAAESSATLAMSSTQTIDAGAKLRYPREPVDLRRVADLVGDQDVLDAGAGEDLGLADLLAADADRAAERLLQLRHVDRLVHLAVGAVAHVVRPGVVAHLPDVALERVEIEDQAGRLDLGLAHAGRSRDVEPDHVSGDRVLHRIHRLLSRSQDRY